MGGFFSNIKVDLRAFLENALICLRLPEKEYLSDVDQFSKVLSSLRLCDGATINSVQIESGTVYFNNGIRVKLMLFNELSTAPVNEDILTAYREHIHSAEESSSHEVESGSIDLYLCAVLTEGSSTEEIPSIQGNTPFSFYYGERNGRVYRISGLSNLSIE